MIAYHYTCRYDFVHASVRALISGDKECDSISIVTVTRTKVHF